MPVQVLSYSNRFLRQAINSLITQYNGKDLRRVVLSSYGKAAQPLKRTLRNAIRKGTGKTEKRFGVFFSRSGRSTIKRTNLANSVNSTISGDRGVGAFERGGHPALVVGVLSTPQRDDKDAAYRGYVLRFLEGTKDRYTYHRVRSVGRRADGSPKLGRVRRVGKSYRGRIPDRPTSFGTEAYLAGRGEAHIRFWKQFEKGIDKIAKKATKAGRR